MNENVVIVFKFLALIGIILVIVMTIINIIKDKVKGTSNQHIFKKRDVSNANIDTLALLLDKIDGYKKIVEYNEFIIVITEYAVNAILVCDMYGILSGQENGNYWYLKSNNNDSKISNPIISFRDKLTKVNSKIGNKEIIEYILLGSNCFLNIDFKNINLVRTNQIFYALSKKDNNKKYTPDEIDIMYKKIKM